MIYNKAHSTKYILFFFGINKKILRNRLCLLFFYLYLWC